MLSLVSPLTCHRKFWMATSEETISGDTFLKERWMMSLYHGRMALYRAQLTWKVSFNGCDKHRKCHSMVVTNKSHVIYIYVIQC